MNERTLNRRHHARIMSHAPLAMCAIFAAHTYYLWARKRGYTALELCECVVHARRQRRREAGER